MPLDDSVEIDEDDADGRDAVVACDTLGCACEDAIDCESGYCLEAAGSGARICSEHCVDTCSLPGFICVLLENSGGDAVRICVPEPERFCDPCDVVTDCGSLRAACVELDDGSFCAPPCAEGDTCPDAATCESVDTPDGPRRVCVPTHGVCADCLDGDGDEHGRGPSCLGPDCDDGRNDVYEGAAEVCDGVDNDCDLSIDDGFDLLGDVDNCGECGLACELDFATPVCIEGECAVGECAEGWGDCDDVPENGCETDLTAADGCGTCAELGGVPDERCGACDTGVWTCRPDGSITCAGDVGETAYNACGGCDPLDVEPGLACGVCDSGLTACASADTTECTGDRGEPARNACGGCATLDERPGDACGPCGLDAWACAGDDELTCDGETVVNGCGGCADLDGSPGEPCGECDSGAWICADPNSVVCDGDLGAGAYDECGRCSMPTSCVPESFEDATPCGGCGVVRRVCGGDCEWGSWECVQLEVCEPGDVETDASTCGPCDGGVRTRTRTCAPDGCRRTAWSAWSDCDTPAVCAPDDEEPASRWCGLCSEGTQTRSRSCDPTTCTWAGWPEWGACVTAAECAPSDEEPASQSCGLCSEGTQTRSRACDPATCTWAGWPEWGACDTAAECAPGDEEPASQSCGLCGEGTQTRSRA